jgi:hypothetical protein
VDLLDVIGVGADLKGKIGRAFALTGALLIYGWTQRWPVAYPLVQAAYEGRAEQMTNAILSALPKPSTGS